MRRRTKIALWVLAGVAGICCLPIIGMTMLFGSNLAVGLYSMAFERQPTVPEMVGSYSFHGEGRPATIRLNENGWFIEEIVQRDKSLKTLSGQWSYEYQENFANVRFRPFDNPSINGNHTNEYTLACYKPRLGKTYLQLAPDTGDEFRKLDR